MQAYSRYRKDDTIGGRYHIYQVLTGGMSEVYLCFDLKDQIPFALKTFKSRYLASPKVRKLFNTEVSTWISLESHPNVVRCFYMETIENRPFMFLEWIARDDYRGTDLRSWLSRGLLDDRLALQFVIDICRGLMHAQQKHPHIVHRDLKPENILISQRQVAKITDFGLAKIAHEAELTISALPGTLGEGRQILLSANGVVGTPAYMAPEQWREEPLDLRTDLYALGCIMYEMLTGRRAFPGTTQDQLRQQHLEAPIPSLRDQCRLPAALDVVLSRCLAKQQDERFVSVEEMLVEVSLIYQELFSVPPRLLPVAQDFTPGDYTNRADTYYLLQRYDDALADLNQALQLDPNFAQAYTNRGNVYDKLQRYEEALNAYTQAIQVAPGLALAYTDRGATYYKLERYAEALADYNRAIELDSTEPLTYTNRGAVYEKLQRYEAALAEYSAAIQLDPTYAPAFYNRGLIYNSLERYADALADYSQTVVLDPTNAPAFANRGGVYYQMQHYAQALADLTQAIQLDSGLAQAYYNRGLTYVSLQRYDDAFDDYAKAIGLNPGYARAYSNRGLLHEHFQQYDQALADYIRALDLDPTLAEAYVNRGSLYYNLQYEEQALMDYMQAIKINPASTTAYLNMGIVLYNRDALHEALVYFEKAAQLGDAQGRYYAVQVRHEIESLSADSDNPS